MQFENGYFEKEEREGFIISSLMKHCWAAQLEVLEQFDRICKNAGIKYFMAYGTLLGAVRHKGFIPWDDDIDIWMFRKDLNKLTMLTEEMISEGLELVSPYLDANYNNLAWRLINTRSIRLDEKFLKHYWMFPFMAGLDIFPLDYLPEGETEWNTMKTLAVSANVLGKMWDNPELDANDKKETYKQLADILGYHKPYEDVRANDLWILTDRICSMYSENDGEDVAVMTYLVSNPRKRFRKEWFSESINMPFERGNFPAPVDYEKILEAEFGTSYMTPIRIEGDHTYPYYRNYQRDLINLFEKNGVECPELYKI